MAKLTKPEIKLHHEALRLLEKDKLTIEDKLFVLEHWQEGATSINSAAGAFFSPPGLARDFALNVCGRRIIDLCAGIGSLSFAVWMKEYEDDAFGITCVELNPAYVEVGKKILPSATWVCGSIFDVEFDSKFDVAISNPPFGNIKTGRENDGLGGFEFSAIVRARQFAKRGVFILPQMSTPFRYSGRQCYEERFEGKCASFIDKTGIEYEFNVGIDTSFYLKDWHGVAPMCEICLFDFEGQEKRNIEMMRKAVEELKRGAGASDRPEQKASERQLTLF